MVSLDVAQQDNGYECGFYLLNFAKSWIQVVQQCEPTELTSQVTAKINHKLRKNTTEKLTKLILRLIDDPERG